ncbi:MAG: alpha-ketoglutarate-dependent dioxygenase AlkB [Bryobacteraceae bacterium]
MARNQAVIEASVPPGLIFLPEFLTQGEECDLLDLIRKMDFRTFRMHGVAAKRRIKQFGWHYAFESYRLTPADPIPAAFDSIRARSAALAGIDPSEWTEALVTEYASGAGIGRCRDAPPFGIVAGISLMGTCRMRLQTGTGPARVTSAIKLPPRSIYLLTGEVRTKWQHIFLSHVNCGIQSHSEPYVNNNESWYRRLISLRGCAGSVIGNVSGCGGGHLSRMSSHCRLRLGESLSRYN